MNRVNGSAVHEKIRRKGPMLSNAPAAPLKLDLGCGMNVKDGFEGVDIIPFEGKVKHVVDLRKTPWPWKDSSVGEVNCSHFLEHLTAAERVAFVNELYRVLIPDGKALIVTPHWASNRAYGDPTHAWPPVSEMWFYYISAEWRLKEAPHTDRKYWPGGFSCDFAATWGYTLEKSLIARNAEYQQFALSWYKEAAQDMLATLVAKKKTV
jgi:SAM-dependent methyltransferase